MAPKANANTVWEQLISHDRCFAEEDSGSFFHVYPDKELGRGANGFVVEARLHGAVAAAKTMFPLHDPRAYGLVGDDQLIKEQRAGFVRSVMTEIRNLSKVKHPNVIEFFGVCYSESTGMPKWIVTEKESYSLDSFLRIDGLREALTTKYAALMMLDVADGLQYLHSIGMIHKDLKPQNVLVGQAGLKICDLGTARIMGSKRMGPTHQTPGPGTISYLPAEVGEVDQQPAGASTPVALYGSSIDVFSFGLVAQFIIIGEHPNRRSHEAALDQPQVERAKHVMPELAELISTFATQDSSLRPEVQSLMESIRIAMKTSSCLSSLGKRQSKGQRKGESDAQASSGLSSMGKGQSKGQRKGKCDAHKGLVCKHLLGSVTERRRLLEDIEARRYLECVNGQRDRDAEMEKQMQVLKQRLKQMKQRIRSLHTRYRKRLGHSYEMRRSLRKLWLVQTKSYKQRFQELQDGLQHLCQASTGSGKGSCSGKGTWNAEKKGRNAIVSLNGDVAWRRHDEFKGALVVASSPARAFKFQVLDTCPQRGRLHGRDNVTFGFTSTPPSELPHVLPDGASQLPKSWVISHNGQLKVDGVGTREKKLTASERAYLCDARGLNVSCIASQNGRLSVQLQKFPDTHVSHTTDLDANLPNDVELYPVVGLRGVARAVQYIIHVETAKIEKIDDDAAEVEIAKIEEIDDDAAEVDASGIEPKDLDLVIAQVSCSRSRAVAALRACNNDIVEAIMLLSSR